MIETERLGNRRFKTRLKKKVKVPDRLLDKIKIDEIEILEMKIIEILIISS